MVGTCVCGSTTRDTANRFIFLTALIKETLAKLEDLPYFIVESLGHEGHIDDGPGTRD